MKFKRIISLLLVISMLAGFCLYAGAAHENTYKNNGDQLVDVIGVAKTQIGYHEGSNNYTKYGVWFGNANVAWCAVFLAWCANQAGVSQSVMPKYSTCDTLKTWFSGKSRWRGSASHGGSYQPKMGDVIFYDWNSNGSADHVGIIETVSGNKVSTIEGNYSDQVMRRKDVSLSNKNVLGFGVPAYNTVSEAALEPGEYKVNAKPYLNIRKSPGTKYEIIGQIPDGAKINVLAIANGWAKVTYNKITGFVSSQYLIPLKNEVEKLLITTLPTKTTYNVGEPLSIVGMVVQGVYTDGSIKNVTDYSVSGFSSATVGTKTVKVTSNGVSATFNVKVEVPLKTGLYEVTATGLNLRKGPDTSYEVCVTIPKGTKVNVTKVSGGWGQVTYNSYTGWVSMTYLKEAIADASTLDVSLSPEKLELYDTQTSIITLKTDLKLQNVTWHSSASNVVSVSNGLVTAIKAGTAVITAKFTYGEKTYTAKSTVTVKQRDVKSIAIKTLPAKTTYTDGENLSISGLVLTVNYDKGSSTTIKTGFKVSGYDKTKLGKQTITVQYGGKTTKYTVSVYADYVPFKTIEFNGHIYSFYDELLSYTNAVAKCKAMGGKLATITSATEQKLILNELENGKRSNYWIGLADGGNSGKFSWTTGEKLSYKNWIEGQPNASSGKNAAMIQKSYNGKWNDVSESYSNAGFICEIDANKIKYTGGKTYNGKSYYRFDTHMSWNDAKAVSEMFGGHLATITSQGELNAVQTLASGGSAKSYWLGASDAEKSGTFKWVTGETFSFNNWLANNPGNTNSIEHYVEMSKAHSYKWNDAKSAGRDNVVTGFIVEIENHNITLDKTDVTVAEGRNVQLNVTVSGGVYKVADVAWISADTGIAKVSETGLVTAVSTGSTIITAEINSKITHCMVTVI